MTELQNNERRSFNRINIPGSKVKYRCSKGLTLLKNYSESSVINVSKSGIALGLSEPVRYGTCIELKISFPDGNDISLKGKIRWQKNVNGNGGNTAGVMFNPFGSKKEYNSMKALEYLRLLQRKASDDSTVGIVET